jgi:hypothetical protein
MTPLPYEDFSPPVKAWSLGAEDSLLKYMNTKLLEKINLQYAHIVVVRVVFHPHVDHRQGAEQSGDEQHPGRNEDVHKAAVCMTEYRKSNSKWSAYGIPTASARHIPAAPADWKDLSVWYSQLNFYKSAHGNSQKPVKWASFAGSFDIAPMTQYAVVCHMASRRPQNT